MAFKRKIDIEIIAEGVDIAPYNSGKVLVTVKDVDPTEIIDKMEIEDVVEYYGTRLLDKIGQARVEEYFDLKPAEE